MDRQLVNQKLESLRRCVQRISSRLPDTAEAFKSDLDAQDIVALNLTRAIQMCVDIGAHWLAEQAEAKSPRTMGQTFEALAEAGVINKELGIRLRKFVGFRNILVHNYDEVNWDIVFTICSDHLSDFKDFARTFA